MKFKTRQSIKTKKSNGNRKIASSTTNASLLNEPPKTVNNIFKNHSNTAKIKSSKRFTPDLINKTLKTFYLNELVIRRLFYADIPLSLGEYYIDLSIVLGTEYQSDINGFSQQDRDSNDMHYESNNALYGQPSILIPADCVIPPNLKINMTTKQQGVTSAMSLDLKPVVKVLILGAAGIGKSTLSEYFTYLWASPEISQDKKKGFGQFSWVFRIPLRNLTRERYPVGTNPTPIDVLIKECIEPAFDNNFNLNTANHKFLETTLHEAVNQKL